MKEAQVAFNAYVRMRDYFKPCISCGIEYENHLKNGGSLWDASHYRSVGSNPSTRFNLHNVAKACVKCNRELSGNIVEYRKGLIDRIGSDKVEALECNCEHVRFNVEYLKRIKKIFNRKKRTLQKRYNRV
jgi:hypothetical protein